MRQRLYRNRTDKVFGGICGGLANYFNIDVVIVRIIFVASALIWGLSLILYLILWIAIPLEPNEFETTAKFTPPDVGEKVGKETTKSKKSREIFAVVLIVLGVFITLDNLFVWFTSRFYMPIILILLGLLILLYSSKKENNKETEQ